MAVLNYFKTFRYISLCESSSKKVCSIVDNDFTGINLRLHAKLVPAGLYDLRVFGTHTDRHTDKSSIMYKMKLGCNAAITDRPDLSPGFPLVLIFLSPPIVDNFLLAISESR